MNQVGTIDRLIDRLIHRQIINGTKELDVKAKQKKKETLNL